MSRVGEWIKMWTATVDFTKAFDSITQINLERPQTCGIEHDYISFLKKLYRDQKASLLTDEESNVFEIKKGTKQGDPLSSLLFNMVLQKALEDDIPRWQKKKGMGIYLSDNDHDCFTDMRFADDVLLFASSKEQLQKMLCEFKRRKRNLSGDHKSRNTDKRRKHEILGPDDYLPATGDDRNQKSNQGGLGDVSQVQTGTDIEKLLSTQW